ncbi:hypothetical protein C8J56DRAFT_485034 [Mycena floridula]|nr:hypothetical protein C8J56DRAFT_485034 [Mycena floridula]
MAAAQHAARYPPPNDDRRLPSIKDLNFHYRSPHAQEPNGSVGAIVDSPVQDRHQQQWSRAPAPPVVQPVHSQQVQHHHHHPQQQQHTPSAAHVVDYAPKHDSAGYLTPGIPLSAQVTPIPGSVTTGTRGDEVSKRPRTTSSNSMNAAREVRPIHTYQGYPSYPPAQPPPASPFHQVPSPHDQQMHHHLNTHPGYPPPYSQPQYVQQPRPPPLLPHSGSYPTGVPSSAVPPPQGHWDHQPQHSHHHVAPPTPHNEQQQQQQQPQQQAHHHHHHHIQPQHLQQPQQHILHHPGPPPQQQPQHYQPPVPPAPQAQIPYSRPPPVIAPSTEQYNNMEPPPLSPRASTMSEVVKLCSMLYSFASRSLSPQLQPKCNRLSLRLNLLQRS